MRRLKKSLLLALSALTLLTACSRKEYILTPCSSIIPLDRVPDVNITTNDDGGLDANNTLKIFGLVYDLRVSEDYHTKETKRLWELNNG